MKSSRQQKLRSMRAGSPRAEAHAESPPASPGRQPRAADPAHEVTPPSWQGAKPPTLVEAAVDQESLAVGKREEATPERHQPLQHPRGGGPVSRAKRKQAARPWLAAGRCRRSTSSSQPSGRVSAWGRAATRPPPLPSRPRAPAAACLGSTPCAVAAGFVGAASASRRRRHDLRRRPRSSSARCRAPAGRVAPSTLGGVRGRNYVLMCRRHGADDGRTPAHPSIPTLATRL